MARLRVGALLPLSGRLARFGRQAAAGLQAWAALADVPVELRLVDCGSEAAGMRASLEELAEPDLLLGPYGSGPTRAALAALAGRDRLLWNHGGAADDVQIAAPGRVVSVLTPASRYAEPFVRRLARLSPAPLRVLPGSGAFAAQVARGAERLARSVGLKVISGEHAEVWDAFVVGTFEEDVAAVRRLRRLDPPPRHLCAVAAGTHEFGRALDDPDGVWGVAQWLPGDRGRPPVGPTAAEFRRAYPLAAEPDYPAVQACAAAALACACVRLAGSTGREALWAAAVDLRTRTLFGAFRIDLRTGAQRAHRTVLARWLGRRLLRI